MATNWLKYFTEAVNTPAAHEAEEKAGTSLFSKFGPAAEEATDAEIASAAKAVPDSVPAETSKAPQSLDPNQSYTSSPAAAEDMDIPPPPGGGSNASAIPDSQLPVAASSRDVAVPSSDLGPSRANLSDDAIDAEFSQVKKGLSPLQKAILGTAGAAGGAYLYNKATQPPNAPPPGPPGQPPQASVPDGSQGSSPPSASSSSDKSLGKAIPPRKRPAILPTDETGTPSKDALVDHMVQTANQASQGPSEDELDLKNAQDKQNSVTSLNQLGKSFDLLGAGIAGTNPVAQDLYDSNIKNAQNITGQAKDRIKGRADAIEHQEAQQETDPNSPKSQQFRDFIGKFGISLPDNTSAATAQKIMPYAYQKFAEESAQKARGADLAEKLAERKEEFQFKNNELSQRKADTQDLKTSVLNTKRFDALNNKLTSEVASGRSAFGMAARNLQSIDNAKALLTSETDPNNLDNRQVYEASKALDRVISQNGGSISGTDHLTPDTARAHLAKQLEFITNNRQGAHAGDFVKNISHTFDRERDQASKQVVHTQKELLGSSYDLSQGDNAQKWDELISSHDLPLDVLGADALKTNGKSRGVSKPEAPTSAPSQKQQALPVDKDTQTNMPSDKTVVKKGYNAKTNQTQFVYSDGTKEIKEGKL